MYIYIYIYRERERYKDKSLVRTYTSTYKGFHSAFAALLSD